VCGGNRRSGAILLIEMTARSASTCVPSQKSAWRLIVRSRNTDIYRMPCASCDHLLVAKCARNPEAFRGPLRREFSALQDIARKTGDALAHTVPRPIAFLEHEGVLVLSDVGGVPLETKLHFQANAVLGWWNLATMRNIGRALGGWLRTFQDATAAPAQPHNHRKYLEEFEQLLSRTRQIGISTTALRHVRDQAEAISASFEDTLICAAAAHGDFLPQNILLDGSRPRVIDFAAYRAEAPVFWDASAFAGYITLLASKKKYSSRALGTLITHLFRECETSWNPSLLRIFVLRSMLQTIGYGPDRLQSAHSLRRCENVLIAVADGTSWLDHYMKDSGAPTAGLTQPDFR